MTKESYVEILREHGRKIDIDPEIGLVAYLGEEEVRDIKDETLYGDDFIYKYEIDNAVIYKGIWELDLENYNPKALTSKGQVFKREGGETIFTFELIPYEVWDQEDLFDEPCITYSMIVNEDYHGIFRTDMICLIEQAIIDELGL